MPIHTECYLSVLKKFKERNPNAQFEIITRVAHHVLSPSWQLLQKYKKDGITFDQYIPIFLHEMERPECQTKLYELAQASKEKDIFLVCYEKDDTYCHRRLVKELIEGIKL